MYRIIYILENIIIKKPILNQPLKGSKSVNESQYLFLLFSDKFVNHIKKWHYFNTTCLYNQGKQPLKSNIYEIRNKHYLGQIRRLVHILNSYGCKYFSRSYSIHRVCLC
jgi:hypothetical protein